MIDRIQVLENRLNSLTTDEPEGTIFTLKNKLKIVNNHKICIT